MSEIHPFYARILRAGTRVAEVRVFGLTARQMKRIAAKVEDKPGVHYVSTEFSCIYLTSPTGAALLAKMLDGPGRTVEVSIGKIDNSGLSWCFVAE